MCSTQRLNTLVRKISPFDLQKVDNHWLTFNISMISNNSFPATDSTAFVPCNKM